MDLSSSAWRKITSFLRPENACWGEGDISVSYLPMSAEFVYGFGKVIGIYQCSVRNSLKVQSMKVLRLPSVCELTGVPRSTLYLYIKNNQFPKPIKLGIQSVGWIQEEVEQWLRQRMQLRDAI